MKKEDREWLYKVRQFNDEDYVGEFNLRLAHKRLIERAQERHFGNRGVMAKALGVSRTELHRMIFQHSL